jgi:cytochrome c-type biogenesis protein CcmE
MLLIRKKRLVWILVFLSAISIAVALILYALRQNINLFYTPSQIVRGEAPNHCRIRIGGMVQKGSVVKGKALEVNFVVTDFKETVKLRYQGILPDLFREGQGVVAGGRWSKEGVFVADEILAKHDENYAPPNMIPK